MREPILSRTLCRCTAWLIRSDTTVIESQWCPTSDSTGRGQGGVAKAESPTSVDRSWRESGLRLCQRGGYVHGTAWLNHGLLRPIGSGCSPSIAPADALLRARRGQHAIRLFMMGYDN